jgi:uncharacterized membrane protein
MDFSVGSTIRFAWATFQKRPWFFVGVTLTVVVIGWACSFISGFIEGFLGAAGATSLGHVLAFAVNFILQTFLGMGTIALYLKAHDAPESAELMNLWHPDPFFKYIVAAIITAAIIILGFALLIVPGIIVSLMLFFVLYLVIDKNEEPLEAIKHSTRLTKGHKWELFLLMLALIGINILGALCLGVGLLVTSPLTSLAIVHAYRQLSGSAMPVASAV